MGDKTCTDCGGIFPHTADHFRKKQDGTWDARCLMCRARANRGKKLKRTKTDMARIESGALNAFTKAAARGGANIPHSSELLETLMEYFGGTSGFAAMMVKQYFDSPPGGSHRTKLIEGITRLVTKNTEMGGAKKPLTQWSDEELEQELDQRLRTIAVSIEGRFIHGPPETPADFALAVGQALGHVPAERTAGDAGGTVEPPYRVLEAVPADGSAGGSPQVPGE
jgi:hypothetical protein